MFVPPPKKVFELPANKVLTLLMPLVFEKDTLIESPALNDWPLVIFKILTESDGTIANGLPCKLK